MRVTRRLNALDRVLGPSRAMSPALTNALGNYLADIMLGYIEAPVCRCCAKFVADEVQVAFGLVEIPVEEWPRSSSLSVAVPSHLREELMNRV